MMGTFLLSINNVTETYLSWLCSYRQGKSHLAVSCIHWGWRGLLHQAWVPHSMVNFQKGEVYMPPRVNHIIFCWLSCAGKKIWITVCRSRWSTIQKAFGVLCFTMISCANIQYTWCPSSRTTPIQSCQPVSPILPRLLDCSTYMTTKMSALQDMLLLSYWVQGLWMGKSSKHVHCRSSRHRGSHGNHAWANSSTAVQCSTGILWSGYFWALCTPVGVAWENIQRTISFLE